MASITIEGSLSPAAGLARGERRTVQDTPDVRQYIEAGFADIVDERTDTEREADDQAEASRTDGAAADAVRAPGKNASADDWRAFLGSQDVEYDSDFTRDELVDLWESREA